MSLTSPAAFETNGSPLVLPRYSWTVRFAVWREEIKTKPLFGVLGGILVLFNSWLTTSNLQTLDTTLRELLGDSS